MPDKTAYMRHLVISAETEGELIEKLAKIPGYTKISLADDLRDKIGTTSDDERFILQAVANGEQIVVWRPQGEVQARTVNVLTQDELEQPVPMWSDEVVILARAIKKMEGLSVEVVAADIDLLQPPN